MITHASDPQSILCHTYVMKLVHDHYVNID